MILAKVYYVRKDLAPVPLTFYTDMTGAITLIKSVLNENTLFAYLMNTDSEDFIKIELVEGQYVMSYVLDLFDFKSEFLQ